MTLKLKETLNLGEGYKSILWFILLTIICAIPFFLLKKIIHFRENTLTDLFGYVVPHILFIFFLTKKYDLHAEKSAVKPSVINYLIAFSGTIVIIFLLDPLVTVFHLPDFISWKSYKTEHISWFNAIHLVIFAPILEEIIFRQIILKQFLKKYSPTQAIIHSSLIWAIIHFNPVQSATAFLFGLFIGWVYFKTQSIWPCILIHAVNNFINFLLTFYLKTEEISFYSLFHDNYLLYAVLYMISIGLIILLIKSLNKFNPSVFTDSIDSNI